MKSRFNSIVSNPRMLCPLKMNIRKRNNPPHVTDTHILNCRDFRRSDSYNCSACVLPGEGSECSIALILFTPFSEERNLDEAGRMFPAYLMSVQFYR
jgi:hypothetical protein